MSALKSKPQLSPTQKKLEQTRANIENWLSKMSLAATKLRKYRRRENYLQKKHEAEIAERSAANAKQSPRRVFDFTT